ncbi:hypothetical protein RUND412_009119 [Rhizina undulata]
MDYTDNFKLIVSIAPDVGETTSVIVLEANALKFATWAVSCTVAVFVALRIWVRLNIIKKGITGSDYILLGVQVLNFIASGVITKMLLLTQEAANYTNDQSSPEWFPTWEKWLADYNKWALVSFPVYYSIIWATKAAYISVYFNIFRRLDIAVKRMLFYSSVYMVISYLITMLVYMLWCRPLSTTWVSASHQFDDFCYPEHEIVVFTVSFVLNLTSELLLLIIPITLISRLQLSIHDRCGLSFIFFLGAVSIASGIARFIELRGFIVGENDDMHKALIWTMAECFCGEMAVCLPALRILLNAISDRIKESASKLYGKKARPRMGPGEGATRLGSAGSDFSLMSQNSLFERGEARKVEIRKIEV